MLQDVPILANPFQNPAALTMAGLIALVQQDADLTPTRRRNLTSSIRTFCRVLDQEPARVPANHWQFKKRLKRFHPAEKGIQVKRWNTIKSDISFCIRRFNSGGGRGFAPLSPEWCELKDLDASSKFIWVFGRLAHYCSAANISPCMVNDRVIGAFKVALEQESFRTKTSRLLRHLTTRWNALRRAHPSSGLQELTELSFRHRATIDWAELPASFRADVEAFLGDMSHKRPLVSDDGPTRVLRPASVAAYRHCIKQAATALIKTGANPTYIKNLRGLIVGDHPKALLKLLVANNGDQSSSQIHNTCHVLVLIAEHWCKADLAVIERLKKYRLGLVLKRDGLRPRPKAALRQFADRSNIEKLLMLPMKILARLSRQQTFSMRDIVDAEVAVALELLLMRPIRLHNLVTLQMGKTLFKVGKTWKISIPSQNVKNAFELGHIIPKESAELLEFYISKILPISHSNHGEWLFPGKGPKGHRSGAQLGRNFSKVILQQTGLRIYPHFMRHFGAFLYLDSNPGGLEIVRRVLAHRSLETTTRHYVGIENESAVRQYDQIILGIRGACEQGVTNASK